MLYKINRAYHIFFLFQFLCLIGGSLVLLLTPPSGIYVFILFGQTIATIIFGWIISHLSNKHLRAKYPQAEMKVSFFIGLTGFRMTGDLDTPLLQQAKLNQDQLSAVIIKQKMLLLLFCGIVDFGLVSLASVVFSNQ